MKHNGNDKGRKRTKRQGEIIRERERVGERRSQKGGEKEERKKSKTSENDMQS